MTLTESNLQFDFDQSWTNLRKYDEQPDVRQVTGRQLSCIDFLGVQQNNKVFLFEVKNFKNRPANQHPSFVEKLLPDSQSVHDKESPLLKTIVKNVKDSLLFLTFHSKRNQLADAACWTIMRQYLENPGNEIHVILWLELDASYPNFPPQSLQVAQNVLSNKLAQRLSWLTRNVMVASAASHPFGASLTITTV